MTYQNDGFFGNRIPDGFHEPAEMSAIEQAELAMQELAEKHSHTMHSDSWIVQQWLRTKEDGA